MYAVYLDYEYEGQRNTVVLGNSISDKDYISASFLGRMADTFEPFAWYVDENDLPAGYKFQTYYVGPYDPEQPMIGVG